ncbi:MAG: type I methionyl aminopeptidase [Acidobacteria bacterium]|nr:type I methionyl aminopeptidase [Acidobacteriota bacterium]
MIICKSALEIETMRRAGLTTWELLNEVRAHVRPGISTFDLETAAEKWLAKRGAKAAFKGLYNYPCILCTSVNDEIVHGIPSPKKVLREGDIVSIDVGVEVDGYYGDSAITVPVGAITPELQKLLKVTEESLGAAIEQMRLGNRVGDISAAVEQHVVKNGFSVVREFVGHGIGRKLHEDPKVPNYGPAGQGPKLKEGMVLAIEPMVNMGHYASRVLQDQWTAVTEDGSHSAHFEHTVVVTKNGPWVLTRP